MDTSDPSELAGSGVSKSELSDSRDSEEASETTERLSLSASDKESPRVVRQFDSRVGNIWCVARIHRVPQAIDGRWVW